jgi:small subunit ribosomal protein S2
MAVISMKTFLEAGVHFGHQTKRWHPNMAQYIYGIKNGVHVIDLRQTLSKLKVAYEYVKVSAAEGRVPLFVGTKTQIQRIVKEEADRCGSPYINFRWLGGLLTNFGTVKQSIARMKTFEEIAGEDGSYEGVIKKEALMMERKRVKLERSLGGVRNMKSVPSILFITDCHKEQLALKEAQKLGIPVIGVADTNCDPTGIDFVIPGNDDSPRAVALYANVISTAVMEGLAEYKQSRIQTPPVDKSPAKKLKSKASVSDKKEVDADVKSQQTDLKETATEIKPSAKKPKGKAEDSDKKENADDKQKQQTESKEKSAEIKAETDAKKVAEGKTAAEEKKVAEEKTAAEEKKAPAVKPKSKLKAKASVKTAEAKAEKPTLKTKKPPKKEAVKTDKPVEISPAAEAKKTASTKAKKVEETETEK